MQDAAVKPLKLANGLASRTVASREVGIRAAEMCSGSCFWGGGAGGGVPFKGTGWGEGAALNPSSQHQPQHPSSPAGQVHQPSRVPSCIPPSSSTSLWRQDGNDSPNTKHQRYESTPTTSTIRTPTSAGVISTSGLSRLSACTRTRTRTPAPAPPCLPALPLLRRPVRLVAD